VTALHDPSQVALDAVPGGDPAAIPTSRALLRGLTAPLLQGSSVARASIGLSAEAVRIALGRSEIEPSPRDWRFKDPAWSDNFLYRRVAQGYLAACAAVDDVLDDMAEDGDRGRAERSRFVMSIVTSALSPTNSLMGNPAALKRTFDAAGTNLVAGARNFVRDVRKNGGMPSTAKPGAFEVGTDLAATPGQVIDTDEVAELLQYAPSTDRVRERPMLIIPPPIGRYYFLDLRPGRSFVEHSVASGLQTFMLSWRNPGPEQSEWDLDTYAQRILTAVDVVREATGSDDVNVIGFCAGGILNTVVLNHLAARGDERIHSASYAVTLLDFGKPAPIGAFAAPGVLALARWNSARQGVISARQMGNMFTWMRPNDLVWNYWVNNYLMGEDPPVFDILSWNADGTNLPAALHRQFLDMFQHNPLPEPGAIKMLGTPVELGRITVPNYVAGAVSDHLTPWKSCYLTTQLLSGESTFALSNAGHIASLVNPPGNAKASYFTAPLDAKESPDEWLARADKHTGSWWEHWARWAIGQSGVEVPAPTSLGSELHPPTAPAPGAYVLEKV
jgi:polyhydroxyalkanoate synthase